MIKTKAKSFINWLTKPRFIELTLGSHLWGMPKQFDYSQGNLNATIRKIKKQNFENLIHNRLIPYFRTCEYHESGLLYNDSQLYPTALKTYIEAKKLGKLDCLNRFITDNEQQVL